MTPPLLTSSPSTSFLSPCPLKLTPSSLILPKRHRFRVSFPRSSAAESPSVITLESKPNDIFGGKRELSGVQSIVSNLSPPLRLVSSAVILAGALAAGYGLGTNFGGGSRNLALGGAAVTGAAGGAVVYALNSAVPEVAAINLHNYVSGFDDPTQVSKEEIEGIAKKYGVSKQDEAFNAELCDLYCQFVSSVLPPGGEELRGNEVETIISFKNALGIDDPDAASMHVEHGRRIFRQRLETGDPDGDVEQRRAFQKLIYVSTLVFGEASSFLLPWKRVFKVTDSQVEIAIRDNAQRLYTSKLKSVGKDIDVEQLFNLRQAQISYRLSDKLAEDLFRQHTRTLIEENISAALDRIKSRTRTVLPEKACPSAAALLDELSSTKEQLSISHSLIAEMHKTLNSTSSLVEALLTELSSRHGGLTEKEKGSDHVKSLNSAMSDEVMLVTGPHKLPLGYSPRMGSDEVYPPVGGACLRYQEELAKYMTYEVGGECPVDDVFAQRLMLKGCEPLPRRRCHPKTPANYVEPTPFPQSLWTTPPDASIIWDPYTCKSYKCLIDRKKAPGYFDCKDCFDLDGRERSRWLFDNGGLDYGIDQVLKTRPRGTIRIGFDIGGGSGTFAARMKERNITIITSSMNLDGPFTSFIASRGLISIHVSVSQRLPFFDNTLDIVHSMHVLSNWIPDAMLEFTLYDIYRVLRPGGLFWLDHFFCLGSQLNQTYVPMLDRVGFRSLRWNAGMKLDRGIGKNVVYLCPVGETNDLSNNF